MDCNLNLSALYIKKSSLIWSSLFPYSLKLRSLRVNVGQLLAIIMPDLDLQQVNYDVDIVDEILGQVVEQMHEITTT